MQGKTYKGNATECNATQRNAMHVCLFVFLYMVLLHCNIMHSVYNTWQIVCVRVCMLYARKTIVKHINGIGCTNEFKSQTQAHVHATRTYTYCTHTHTHLQKLVFANYDMECIGRATTTTFDLTRLEQCVRKNDKICMYLPQWGSVCVCETSEQM